MAEHVGFGKFDLIRFVENTTRKKKKRWQDIVAHSTLLLSKTIFLQVNFPEIRG